MTRPHVSSAAAYDGASTCRFDETTIPSLVQASISHVGVNAALADQLERGQSLQQRRADCRSLTDQDERLAAAQALRQHLGVVHVVVPDGDVMAGQQREAGQRPQRVEIVIQNRNPHGAQALLIRKEDPTDVPVTTAFERTSGNRP